MKKKISLIISVIVLILGFTGCAGAQKDKITYDPVALEQITEIVIGSFTQMTNDDFQSFMDGSELETNLTLMQTGLPVEQTAFISMIKSWNAAIKECGIYKHNQGYEIEATSTEVIVKTEAVFEKRKAEITLIFDSKSNIKSLTVDPVYSRDEILKKAGLNTAIGMGTVFAVLIFISIIISFFRIIPFMEAKHHKKSKQPTKTKEKLPSNHDTEEITEIENQVKELEIIAAITAAIATSLDTSPDEVVIRSIKRKTSNKWK